MVILNKIYTKTGDAGTTALSTGERRPKHDLRVSAYGTVDETNATIGIVRLHTAADPELAELDTMLGRIQNDLFDLGADLCTPDTGETLEWEPLRIVEAQVTRLESEIDRLNADLKPLRSFVLPGGTPAAAHLHLARTVSRRAERLMVELAMSEGERVGEMALKYANRLSDFLFVASRWANGKGSDEVLWVAGQNR
ncbi:cob(I)yrinic acid a,c-diamide adenosyltransferase [Microbaculum sp. FT89]|uniref:cob(I)yrinic acid a,c-diamide adenosyltransferase n=1 Tax=Microbaculum sp. FT89 TaxID=3447298 RepID=UPI003F5351EE